MNRVKQNYIPNFSPGDFPACGRQSMQRLQGIILILRRGKEFGSGYFEAAIIPPADRIRSLRRPNR
jgi:hypothetical protein